MSVQTKLGVMDIRILRFQTRFTTQENGEVKSEDWVHFCAPGQAERAVNIKRVAKILRATADKEMAFALRQSIEPSYLAWKAGNEVPLEGTPLAAWPGVTPEHIEVLQFNGIKTVEQVASLGEGELTRVKLPEMRSLKTMAERFLTARDGGQVRAELAKKDEQIAAMQAQLEELAALVKGDPQASAEQVKRGPGRPRKEEAAA